MPRYVGRIFQAYCSPHSNRTVLSMLVRVIDTTADLPQIRACAVELQEFERRLDSRLPSGEEIADEYVAERLKKCDEHRGRIFVADAGEFIAGYITVLTNVSSGDLDDGDIHYSFIDDVVVREQYRGSGVGKQLFKAAESFARANDSRWLRLSVFAMNSRARGAYETMGFVPLYVDYEKDLGRG